MTQPTTTRAEYIRSGRWFPIVIFAIVFAVACVFLAQWQMSRLDDRRESNLVIAQGLAADEAAPESLGAPGEVLTEGEASFRPVTARGTYLPETDLLVRQRSFNESTGYWVASALRTDEGPVLWVVRGWIPAGVDARTPSAVPAPPSGVIEVAGRARAFEEPLDSTDLPSGQVRRLSWDEVQQATPLDSYGFWIQAETENPEAASSPERLPSPTISEGPHLNYAIQWVLFAVGGIVGAVVLIRRSREYFEEDAVEAANPSASQPPRP